MSSLNGRWIGSDGVLATQIEPLVVEELTIANFSELNNADSRLPSCPMGAARMRHCGIAPTCN